MAQDILPQRAPSANGQADTQATSRKRSGRFEADEVKIEAASRRLWPRILNEVAGIPDDHLSTRHGPCPKCGGVDRWRCFNDFEKTGGALCNQCCGKGMADGFAVIQWFTGDDFPTAVRKVAEWLGMTPTKSAKQSQRTRRNVRSAAKRSTQKSTEDDDLIEKLEFQPFRPQTEGPLQAWCSQHGISTKTAHLAGVRPAVFMNDPVWAFPVVGESLDPANPVRYMLAIRYGKGFRSKKDGARRKTKTIGKRGAGALTTPALREALAAGEDLSGRPVEKYEGLTDFLAALDLNPESLAFTNACGAGESPPGWITKRFRERNADQIYVIHDCDEPGKKGAARCCRLLGARNVPLPYETTKIGGNDFRDWVNDQKEQGLENDKIYDKWIQYRETHAQTVTDADVSQDAPAGQDDEAVSDASESAEQDGEPSDQGILKNYVMVPSKSDNPHVAWEPAPRPLPEIAADLLEMRDGWPKACDSVLFVPAGDDFRSLIKPNDLFGWIASVQPADFKSRGGFVGRQDFHAELPYHVEQFEAIETAPHFPPIANHFYPSIPEPGSGEHLQQFLDFFTPASEVDRELIVAFVATTFWGGAPGRRVAFGIDSISGTGAGKTALATRVASLTGGFYDFAADTKEELLRKELMNGELHRVAILDNLKESRLSSAVIEGLVTNPQLSGHRLNIGFGTRPNTLVWVFTMNGLAMSRDLAQRTVVIRLAEPKRSPTWDDEMDRFIREHRSDVAADVAAFFQRSPVELGELTRWASWETAVLARLDDPEAAQEAIRERTATADEDQATAAGIIELFANRLEKHRYDIKNSTIHIPSKIAAEWLTEATGREFNQRGATATIKNLISSGSLKGIESNPSRKVSRGWLWNPGNETVDYSLEQRKASDERAQRTLGLHGEGTDGDAGGRTGDESPK